MGSQDATLRLLLKRTAARDTAAFHNLYCAMHGRLLRFLYRFTDNTADAEDLLNDVMLTVWRSAANFRGDAQVSTWVLGIANIMGRRWLRQHKFQRHLSKFPLEENTLDSTETWLEQQSVAEGLAKLSNDQRITVELAYFFGYSCEEIAQRMHCPTGTVKTRLFHARQHLRDFISSPVQPR